MLYGLGFNVRNLGFKVLRFRVSGFRVSGLGLGFGFYDLGCPMNPQIGINVYYGISSTVRAV